MKTETTVKKYESRALREYYYEIRHRSGLPIYVFPKKMYTAYAVVGVQYGALDNCFRLSQEAEPVRVPDGIAHFLEHKMFESEDGSDSFEQFARIGASANAFTSHDMTAYEFSCTEHFDEALPLLLKMVTHPYFTDENVQKEQGIIGQEIGMYDDNPQWQLFSTLMNLLYTADNVRINVCGTVSSIAAITPACLYRCYRTFYNLRNMALVICGDVDYPAVIATADSLLPDSESTKIERYFPAEPEEVAARRKTIRMNIGKPLFAIGIKDIRPACHGPEGVKRRIAFRMISELLFAVSGKLYNELYDAGLINADFSAEYEYTRTCGCFVIGGESDDPEEVYRRTMAAIREAKATPFLTEDFARIKRSMYADYIRGFDTIEGIANALLSDVFEGVDLFSVGDILAGITEEDVRNVLRDAFVEERCAMAVIEPDVQKTEEA